MDNSERDPLIGGGGPKGSKRVMANTHSDIPSDSGLLQRSRIVRKKKGRKWVAYHFHDWKGTVEGRIPESQRLPDFEPK